MGQRDNHRSHHKTICMYCVDMYTAEKRPKAVAAYLALQISIYSPFLSQKPGTWILPFSFPIKVRNTQLISLNS